MKDFKILSLGVPVKLSADQSDYLCKELEAKDERIAELEAALTWSRDSNTGYEPSLSVMHRYYDQLIPATGNSK